MTAWFSCSFPVANSFFVLIFVLTAVIVAVYCTLNGIASTFEWLDW